MNIKTLAVSLCLFSINARAQIAEPKSAPRGEVVFKDDAIVIEKHVGVGKITLDVMSGPGRFRTCSVSYPSAIGAGTDMSSLAYLPREAAKICHYALPEIRAKVYGGPLKELVRALGGGRVLTAPIDIEFLTDADLAAFLVRMGFSQESARAQVAYQACSAVTSLTDRRLVMCRAAIWTNRTYQADLKIAFVHEMVHFALEPNGYTPIVRWVNEGLANHIAFRLDFATKLEYRRCDARVGILRHYTKGYSCGSALLYYAAKYWELDLQALALDLVGGKGADPAALDRLIDAHIKNRHGIARTKTITADALYHQCLLVPASLHGCQGGAPHVDQKGRGFSDPGCKWCRDLRFKSEA